MVNQIDKYWGLEEWLVVTKYYVVKRLTIKQGLKIKNHYHEVKDETFYISKGKGIVILNGNSIEVKEGDYLHIFPTYRHEVIAVTDLVIIESSTPQLTDSVRVK